MANSKRGQKRRRGQIRQRQKRRIEALKTRVKVLKSAAKSVAKTAVAEA